MNSSNILSISTEAAARLQQPYNSLVDAAADVCREAIGDTFTELGIARAKVQELEADIEKWCDRLTRVTQDDLNDDELAELGFYAVAS